MTVRFLAEAETELDAAVAYYEAQVAGLGSDFAAEVRAGIVRIEEYPEAWQLLGRRVRRYRLNRFRTASFMPCGTIVIVAVMHLHRKPDYWQRRTEA